MANENTTIDSVIADLKSRGYTPEQIQETAANITRGNMTLNPNKDLIDRVARGVAPTEYTPPATELIQDQEGYDPETNTIKPVSELSGLAAIVERNKQAISPKPAPAPVNEPQQAPAQSAEEYVPFAAQYESNTDAPKYDGFDLSGVDTTRVSKLQDALIRNSKAVIAGKEVLRDRTLGEHVQDVAVAVGPVMGSFVANTAYGIAEVASQYSPQALATKGIDKVFGTDFHTGLDEATASLSDTGEAFSQKLQKMTKAAGELKSEPLKAQEAEVNARIAKRQEGKAERIAALEKRGKYTALAHVIDMYEDVVAAGSEYIKQPGVVASAVAEAVPQILLGGVVGKVATRVALSKVTPDVAARFLSTDAGKKAIQKVATRANIGYVAVTEGFTNAVDAKATVLNSTPDDLRMSNPEYVKLVDEEGMSHEKAKHIISEDTFNKVLVQTGLAAGVISKATGAAHFQGNLFTPGTKLAKALPTGLTKGALAGGAESLEEAGQSGTGKLIQNVALKDAAIAGQDITEGVGGAIAIGGLAGFGSGAMTTGTVGAVNDILDATGLANDGAKIVLKSAASKLANSKAGVAFKNKKLVDNAIKGGAEAQAAILDTTSETYDAETAINLVLDKRNIGTTGDEVKASAAEASKHVTNLLVEAQQLTEAEGTTVEQEEEATRKAAAGISFLRKVAALQNLDNLTPEEMTSAVNSAVVDNTEEQNKETVAQVLGSAPTVKEARKLLESTTLDKPTRSRVTNYVNTLERIEAVTANDVTNAVVNGDESNLGITDHLRMVRTATDANDKKTAVASLKNLATFTIRHSKKLDGLKKAWAEYRKDPSPELIARVKKEFNFELQPGSGNLIKTRIEPEVKALKAAFIEGRNYIETGTGSIKDTALPDAVPAAPKDTPISGGKSTEASIAPNTETTVKESGALDKAFKDTDFSKYPKFMELAARNAKTPEEVSTIIDVMEAGVPVESAVTQEGEVIVPAPKAEPSINIPSYTNEELNEVVQSANLPDTTENRELSFKVKQGAELAPEQLTELRKIVSAFEGSKGQEELGEIDSAFETTNFSKYPSFIERAARLAKTPEEVKTLLDILNTGAPVEGIVNSKGEVVAKAPPKDKSVDIPKYTNQQLSTMFKEVGLPDTPANRNLGLKLERGLKLSLNQLTKMRKVVERHEKLKATQANEKLTAVVSSVVGGLVNEKTVLGELKSKAGIVSDNVKRHFTKVLNKFPEDKRVAALKNIKAGILAYNEGKDLASLSTTAHRAGYVTAKRFLAKPVYSVKRMLDKSGSLSDTYTGSTKEGNVLHSTEDFINNFDRESDKYKELDVAATEKLENMVHYAKEFAKAFAKTNVAEAFKFPESGERSPFTEFFNLPDNFTADSNIITAMAMQGYNYLSDKTDEGRISTPDSVMNLFPSRDSVAPPSEREMAFFGDVGTNRRILASSLGRGFLKTAGIKPNKATAPRQMVEKMEINAGLAIIEVMEEQGLVETTTILNKDIGKIIGDEKAAGREESTLFVNIAGKPDDKNTPKDELKRFVENIGAGRKVMEEYFDIDSKQTRPSREVPKFKQKVLKGTMQHVPKRVAKIIQKHMERPQLLKEGLVGVFMDLDLESQRAIGGQMMDTTLLHAEQRDSAEAKNKALDREIEFLKDFWADEEGRSKPFYFTHVVWKNFRMGIASNTINPQTSKIHRHAMGAASFVINIAMNNRKLVDNFTIAVGEALGTGPDKTSKARAIKDALTVINKPVIQDAVSAYIQIKNGDITSEAQAALVAGVNAGGNAMYSLDGIAALAAQKEALDAGLDSFTTDLGREVDGVTNGVAIGISQLISGSNWGTLRKMFERVGMFTDKDEEYGHWANGVGNYDSYEDTSLTWMTLLKDIHENIFDKSIPRTKKGKPQTYIDKMRDLNVTPKKLNALRSLVGTFRKDELDSAGNILISKVGRALAKNPLMITNYGAAMAKVVEEFVGEIIDKIHSDSAGAINDMQQANLDGNEAAWYEANNRLKTINAAVNEVLGNSIVIDKENGLTSERDVTVFTAIISNYYGEALDQAIQKKFSTFIRSRKILNTALDYTATMFNAMYDDMVAIRTAQWKEENPGKKFIDLTEADYTAIYEEIVEYAPIAKNFYSDNADDSAMLSNTESRSDDRNGARVINPRNKPRAMRHKKLGFKGIQEETVKSVKNMNSQAAKKRFASPGVGGVIGLIHGMDASTMMGSLEEVDGLNVHDAKMFALDKIEEGTTGLNKSFADVVLGDYSIVAEIYESFAITHDGYFGTKESKLSTPEALDFREKLEKFGDVFKQHAEQTVIYREEIRERIKTVQQYNKGVGGKADNDYTSPILEERRLRKQSEAALDSFLDSAVAVYTRTVNAKTKFSQKKAKELLARKDELLEVSAKGTTVYLKEVNALIADLKAVRKLGRAKTKTKPSKNSVVLIESLLTAQKELAEIDTTKGATSTFRGEALPKLYEGKEEEVGIAFESRTAERNALVAESGISLTPEIESVIDSFMSAPIAIFENRLAQLVNAAKPTLFTEEYRSSVTEVTQESMDTIFEGVRSTLDARKDNQLISDTEIAHLSNDLAVVRKGIARSQDNSATNREALKNALKDFRNLVGKQPAGKALVSLMSDDTPTDEVTRNSKLAESLAYKSKTPSAPQLSDVYSVYPELETIVGDSVKGLIEGEPQVLGSAQEGIDVDNFGATFEAEIDSLTSEALFTKLGKTGAKKDDAAHTAHLSNLLTSVVNKVIEPFKFELRSQSAKTLGAQVGNRVLLDTGTSPLASSIGLSAQETYVHELVHYISKAGLNAGTLAARKVEKLWELARKTVTATDFLSRDDAGNILNKDGQIIDETHSDYAIELAEATKRYDYIFNNTTTDSTGKNAYLHEFITFGVTNKAFISKLSEIKAKDISSLREPGKNIAEKLWNIFAGIMDSLTNKFVNINGLSADTALLQLLEDLASVEDRKRSSIGAVYDAYNMGLDYAVRKLADFVIRPITKIFTSDLFKKNSALNGIASFIEAGKTLKDNQIARYPVFRTAIKEVVKRLGFSEKSLLLSLAHEINGTNGLSGRWEELNRKANKMIDQLRVDTMKKVAGHLSDTFVKDSLTPVRRAALTLGLLKTDTSALLDDGLYSAAKIRKLFKSPVLLREEISKLEEVIASEYGANKNYYIKMAKSLSSMMVRGIPTEYETKLNSYVIANLYETDLEPVGDLDKANEHIDVLATLHAIKRLDAETRKEINNTFDDEFEANTEHNGITFLLAVHKDHKERALDGLFDGDPTQFRKGYTKEIFDPNISIEYGSPDDEEIFNKSHFTKLGSESLMPDNFDPNRTEVALYINPNGGNATWQQGATSLTSRRAAGTSLLSKRVREANEIVRGLELGDEDNAAYYDGKAARLAAINSDAPSELMPGENAVIPIINQKGGTAGYRYMMREGIKNSVLNKNNDFAQIMGGMEASIKDKQNTLEINKEVVRTAYEQYKSEYSKNPENFVYVGLESNDAEYREIYQMLPAEMRKDIKSTWRRDGMFVPDTLVPLIFGQRKWVASALGSEEHIDSLESENMKALFTQVGKFTNNKRVVQAGGIWKEIIKGVKDIIVIRSGTVLLGNIISNVLLLSAKGVNPVALFKNHVVAIEAATAYQKDTKELDRLERLARTGNGSQEGLVKIARLKNSIANNKVKDLIDEGIYQSIVEDISTVDDTFTYRNRLENWVAPVTDKIPAPVKTGLRYATFAQDTSVYKFLRDTTQLSDFVARYTLHEANLANNMSKKDSLTDIVRTFIDYDLPTHKYLQYANDMGAVMFTKFFLRIQRVLADLIINHPGKVLSIALLQNALGPMSDVMDSNAITSDILGKINVSPLDAADGVLALPVVGLVSN